jgi:hypothetical protein
MRHQHYLIIAGLSLAASACMAALPIIAPHASLAPFLVTNWALFIMTGLLLRRRMKVPDLTWKQSRIWDLLFGTAFIAFAAAGWFAILSGNPVA